MFEVTVMDFTCENHSQLARIFSSLLYFFCHELEWEISRDHKIQQWAFYFLFKCMSCINYVGSWGWWFSHVKTIYNLHIFFSSLLYVFFTSWNAKYRGTVKYNNGSLFLWFPWMTCINYVYNWDSWFSHLKTIYALRVVSFSQLYFLFMSWNGKYRRTVKYSNEPSIFDSNAWVA